MIILLTLFLGVFSQEIRNIAFNRAVYHSSAADFDHTGHLLTNGIVDRANNYWKSQKNVSEYVYIDFGAVSTIQTVNIVWPSGEDGDNAYSNQYDLEVSNDTKTWRTVLSSTSLYQNGGDVNITLLNAIGSYLRLNLIGIANNAPAYKIYQINVYGTNDFIYKPQALPLEANNKQYLRGGNWKVQRLSEVDSSGEVLTGLDGVGDGLTQDWLVATVPSTVLVSYLNAGAIPDPNYADQQLQISDRFFTTDFWYYDTFNIYVNHSADTIWLNFEGINWKADVFFNGQQLGRIEGGFIRGRFDITKLAQFGSINRLAVLIHANDNPGVVDTKTLDYAGKNGGVLGADNPTFHASIGWDWIPVIRGRNIGIYNDVFLSYSRIVTIQDPWVETHLNLPDLTRAENIYRTELEVLVGPRPNNSSSSTYNITISVTVNITLPSNSSSVASETTVVILTRLYPVAVSVGVNKIPVTIPFVLRNPLLWYPNRYGAQNLYTAHTTVSYQEDAAEVPVMIQSDTNTFSFGVREIRYNKEGTFKIFINGKRIYCTGGNWGMDESMLRANNQEEHEIRVRLHKEAGFTIIRNWVGMTGNEWFYRMCDKYGILVHDDFWLANPVDGPNPNDNAMFLANARDKIKKVRKYTSIAYYCGRNEGQPPGGENNDGDGLSATEPLDLNRALREATVELDGSRFYIADSADNSYGTVTSGHGPYTVRGPDLYFSIANENFHTERGMPNVPCVESIRRMLSPDAWWPIGTQWGLHDFALSSAQNGNNYIDYVKAYGPYTTLEQFVARAQFVNFENYKAIFEAPTTARGNAMLLWMSQSAWPSMVWQTYDYYFDTNAGYFGSKKGNQNINPVYNYRTRQIQVVNNAAVTANNLSLLVKAYGLDGTVVGQTVRNNLTITPDEILTSDFPYTPRSADSVLFLQTLLFANSTTPAGDNGVRIADNIYWVDTKSSDGSGPRNFTAISSVQNVTLVANGTDTTDTQGIHRVRVNLQLSGQTPALLVRLKVIRNSDRTIVLPTYYSDNYVFLFAGSAATNSTRIDVEFAARHLNDSTGYSVYVEGFNVAPVPVAITRVGRAVAVERGTRRRMREERRKKEE